MPMIGPKNRLLVIEQPTETPDSLGDPVASWGQVCTVWASIRALRGDERFMARQTAAEITHRIRINYDPRMDLVTPKWRAKLSRSDSPETFRIFEFVSVENIGEHDAEFEILALERY